MERSGPGPRKVHTAHQAVAVVHETVRMDSLTTFFARAFGTVMAAVQQQGARPTGPPFALYRGTPGETVDVEAGFPVTPGFQGTEGVANDSLPETDAFEAMHLGPYETLGQSYEVIQGRMKAEGLTPADTMWEFYLSDPQTEPDPAKWQTRIVWPIAGTEGSPSSMA